MQIVHLSDLHIGSQFQLAVFEQVVQEINQLKPDAIIITGDLTNEGLIKQYEESKKLISKFDAKKIIKGHSEFYIKLIHDSTGKFFFVNEIWN